jgi:NIPSNAP
MPVAASQPEEPFVNADLQTCCPVVELRQYTLHPGQRGTLIELFEREFLSSQEALGMTVIGQFRNADNPDSFVWLRGFPDMVSRARSLKDFYEGPIWKAHREAANATMIDSDNVLLLRPARKESGFSKQQLERAGGPSTGVVVATIYYFDPSVNNDFIAFFEQTLEPIASENGASFLASFVTESSPNNFPALPLREGENAFVWFTHFANQASYEGYSDVISKSERWRAEVSSILAQRLIKQPEILRLIPTTYSRLHG